MTDARLRVYNQERLHDGLGHLPPLTYVPRHTAVGQSSIELSHRAPSAAETSAGSWMVTVMSVIILLSRTAQNCGLAGAHPASDCGIAWWTLPRCP